MFILVLHWSSSDAYRILALFPYPGKSHFDIFNPLVKALAEKGHDVTVVSHFPQKTPIPNLTDISLENTSNNTVDVVDANTIPQLRIVKYVMPLILASMTDETCKNLNHPNLKQLLDSKKKFDLILIEHFNTDCFLSVVHLIGAPFIGLTSHILMPWTNERLGNIDNPAYVPNHFLGFSDKMTFVQRVENTLMYVWCKAVEYFILERQAYGYVKETFGNEIPPLYDIAKNISLILVNTHFTLNRPRPVVPGYIDINGIHVRKQQELPQNIKRWIEESEKGVIYFCMGSMIKGHTFPEDKRQAFLRAFARLEQRVLWKWENETMPEKPDNVMIQKWLPQLDILCHPNVKAFISHGGLLGTTEAVHCGVPVIVMPQFGDQHTNAAALEASGGGIVFSLKNADETSIFDALQKVLSPESARKAKELSERFRDRPMSPLDTAIYWVEYVARHKGAHHLRTAAVGMPWYQYVLLDVTVFIAIISIITLYVTIKTFKMLCCKNRNQRKIKKN